MTITTSSSIPTTTTTTSNTNLPHSSIHQTSSTTSSSQQQQQQNQSLPNETDELGKYGLKGLSSLVRMEQSDFVSFAIGQDISKCGLDLSKNVEILKNLSSPWSETSRSEVEPYFKIPLYLQNKSINNNNLNTSDSKIQQFTDETLFYIFYMKPRDTLQEYAARELVARNWRYHKDIQVWLTKDSNVEPILIGQDVEKGVYIFFDPHNWEKIRKEFVLHYSSVQA